MCTMEGRGVCFRSVVCARHRADMCAYDGVVSCVRCCRVCTQEDYRMCVLEACNVHSGALYCSPQRCVWSYANITMDHITMMSRSLTLTRASCTHKTSGSLEMTNWRRSATSCSWQNSRYHPAVLRGTHFHLYGGHTRNQTVCIPADDSGGVAHLIFRCCVLTACIQFCTLGWWSLAASKERSNVHFSRRWSGTRKNPNLNSWSIKSCPE